MGDRYVLGFAGAKRDFSGVKFCADSTKVLRMKLYTEVPRVHTHAKRSNVHVKDAVVHVSVGWIMETQK